MKGNTNYFAFLWHAVFLAVTVTFTEINTILPAMVIQVGGSEIHIGFMTAIMVGVPLFGQLVFAGYLHGKPRKKPFLIAGINIRLLSLGAIGLTLFFVTRVSPEVLLLIIYLELLVFTIGGAFASVSYVDIVGKSFTGDLRKSFFVRKQFIAGIGILVSALIARGVLKRYSYPESYAYLFLLASGVLVIASLGFYVIRESGLVSDQRRGSFVQALKSIPSFLRADPNLKNYILVSNMLGFSVVLLPFYIARAREQYTLEENFLGNLLLIQISGMVVSSLIWSRVVKKRGFKGILFIWAGIAVILPWLAYGISTYLPAYAYLPVFLVTGSLLSAYRITREAVVVEISTDENRVLYSGIIGTFNLTLALFPIIIGWIIGFTGYVPVFIIASVLSISSVVFISRLNCPVDRLKR